MACKTHPSCAILQTDTPACSKPHITNIRQSRGLRMIFFTKSNLQASLMVRNCRNTRHVTLSYECLDFGCHVLQYDLWLVPENFSPRTSVSPLPMLYTIRTSVSPLQKLSTIRNSVFPLQNSIPLERPFLLYNSSIPLELPFLLYKTLYH